MTSGLTKADESALSLLLAQKLYRPRFDVRMLKFERLKFEYDIAFYSIQSFCENSRATLADMEIGGRIPDGYTIRRTSGNNTSYIVLYNADVKSAGRKRFTLAHELGHILLNHTDDGARQEAEADRFAAQLLLPRVFAWELLERSGFLITARELAGIFGVSTAMAKNRLRPMKKENPPVFSADEIKLLDKFGGLLPRLDGPIIDC